MKWFWLFYTVYWFAYAIVAWSGQPIPTFSIGCGFMMAAIGCANSALDYWFKK